jgi:signal transduction histidine kinase
MIEARRRAAERRAIQNEKLSTLGLIASSIAHEVKNPLSSIKTIATVMAEDLGDRDPHAEDLRLIIGEVDRLSATAGNLLEFARPAANGAAAGSVADAIERTARLLRHRAGQKDVELRVEVAAELPPVRADGDSLREIFLNLVLNSIEAAGRGGTVTVSCRRSNGGLLAEVRDDGPGIPPEARERIFEPFFTTRADGTGLGLAIVARRVRELGGEVSFESEAGKGSTFAVKLPVEE